MTKYIVDTNVLLAADTGDPPQHATHLSFGCRQRALDWLQTFLQNRDTLIVDHAWQILGEYQKKSRQDDYATLFLKEAFNLLEIIEIEIDPNDKDQALLPEPVAEIVHDLADRKFVAVALAHPEHPPVINCADTDWLDWEDALAEYEISCYHLCPDELQQLAERKRAKKGGHHP